MLRAIPAVAGPLGECSQPAHWPCSHHLVKWRVQAWRHTAIHGYLVLSHTSKIAIFSHHGRVSTSEHLLQSFWQKWHAMKYSCQQQRFGCTCSRHTKRKNIWSQNLPQISAPLRYMCLCLHGQVHMLNCWWGFVVTWHNNSCGFISRSSTKVLAKSPIGSV